MKNHKVLLFLDFDGVLHPYPFHPGFGGMFCHVPKLKEVLADFPEVGVVVHSSWRCCPEVLVDGGLNEYLQIGDAYLGTTDPEILSRWESIKYWCHQDLTRLMRSRNVVIMDDFGGSFPDEAKSMLICTQGVVGATDADWAELRRRLQGFRDAE